MATIQVDRSKLFSNIAFMIFGALIVAGFMWPRNLGPDKPIVGPKAHHVVVLIDSTSPTIPQRIVLDHPLVIGATAAGRLAVIPISDEFCKQQGYDQLQGPAGGAPCMLFLTKDGECVEKCKLPTDERSLEAKFAKYLEAVPPPLGVRNPRPDPVVSRGSNVQIFTDGAIGPDGTRYKLGALPSTPAMKAGLPKYGASNPLFPATEWRPVVRRAYFGSEKWILNQGEISSCVGNGWAGGARRCRFLSGQEDVELSPGWIYSLLNGNRDEGAIISQGIKAMLEVGTVPFDLVGQKPFYQRQMPKEAKDIAHNFRAFEIYQCTTWEETISALQSGYMAVFGTMVGRNFNRFDSYGVCGQDPGPGNHCVMADGCTKLGDGRWVVDMVNSWGYEWGPFKNGRAYLEKGHLFGPGDMPDVCVIRSMHRHPKDRNAPPPVRLKAGDALFADAF